MRNRHVQIVNDADKIKRKFDLLHYSTTAKRYQTKKNRLTENEVLGMVMKDFACDPEKLHHSYIKDLEKQLKMILTY